jgi:hypothetical protein
MTEYEANLLHSVKGILLYLMLNCHYRFCCVIVLLFMFFMNFFKLTYYQSVSCGITVYQYYSNIVTSYLVIHLQRFEYYITGFIFHSLFLLL